LLVLLAGGSAAVRTFEKFFKAGFKVKGEFEDLGSGMDEYLWLSDSMVSYLLKLVTDLDSEQGNKTVS